MLSIATCVTIRLSSQSAFREAFPPFIQLLPDRILSRGPLRLEVVQRLAPCRLSFGKLPNQMRLSFLDRDICGLFKFF